MSNSAFDMAWDIAKEKPPFGPINRRDLNSGYPDCPECRGTMGITECKVCEERMYDAIEEKERREEDEFMADFLEDERRDQMDMDEAFGVNRDTPNLPPPKSEGGGDMRRTEKRPIGREDAEDNRKED